MVLHKTFKIFPFVIFSAILCLGAFSPFTIYSQMIKTYGDGPIHEAFVTQVSGNFTLQAISVKPPEQINERMPRQLDMQSEWISGYWAWEPGINDFIWVSGIWRRPPPGHQWALGFWKKYNEGWVWISGFWSPVALQNVDYIGIPPPDPIDENMAPPSTNNEFWLPGFWHFLFDRQEYRWVSGGWEELDPKWIFVPSHYIWRPGGYVFIPAYWDWPLEGRGTAYSCVFIEPDYRYRVVFEPVLVLKPERIVRRLFLYYPDYLCLFYHHWHYHPQFWKKFCCAPSWWSWETWWTLSWHDHWGLWWWYTHPGYPQPHWLTVELTSILPPPLSELTNMFASGRKPPMITPNGVVSREKLLQAMRKTSGEFTPILPSKPNLLNKIFHLAKPKSIDSDHILSPMGRRLPIDPTARRPHVRKPAIELGIISRIPRIREGHRPRIPFKPKIPSHRRIPVWRTERPLQPTYTPPVRRPTWTPRPSRQSDTSKIVPRRRMHSETSRASETPEQEDSSPSTTWRPRPLRQEQPIKRPPIRRMK